MQAFVQSYQNFAILKWSWVYCLADKTWLLIALSSIKILGRVCGSLLRTVPKRVQIYLCILKIKTVPCWRTSAWVRALVWGSPPERLPSCRALPWSGGLQRYARSSPRSLAKASSCWHQLQCGSQAQALPAPLHYCWRVFPDPFRNIWWTQHHH